jgi:hypothetical protein
MPGKIGDRLHIYGRFLASEREEAPRSIAGERVACFPDSGVPVHFRAMEI